MLLVLAKLKSDNGNIIGYKMQDIDSNIVGNVIIDNAVYLAKNKMVLGCKTYKTDEGKELLIGDNGPNHIIMSKIPSIVIRESKFDTKKTDKNATHVNNNVPILEVTGNIAYGNKGRLIRNKSDKGIIEVIETGVIIGYVIKNISDKDIIINRESYISNDQLYIKNGTFNTVLKPNESLLISREDLARLQFEKGVKSLFANGKAALGIGNEHYDPLKKNEEVLKNYFFLLHSKLRSQYENERLPITLNIMDDNLYNSTGLLRVKQEPEIQKLFGYCNNRSIEAEAKKRDMH